MGPGAGSCRGWVSFPLVLGLNRGPHTELLWGRGDRAWLDGGVNLSKRSSTEPAQRFHTQGKCGKTGLLLFFQGAPGFDFSLDVISQLLPSQTLSFRHRFFGPAVSSRPVTRSCRLQCADPLYAASAGSERPLSGDLAIPDTSVCSVMSASPANTD